MFRAVLVSAIALALMGSTFCGDLEGAQPGEPIAATAAYAEANQRFVINFCYAQYRGQRDIMRCLARCV